MNPIQQLYEQLLHHPAWKKKQVIKRNEFLKVKGSADLNIYFVESGSLRIFIEDESDGHTIRFAYKNSLITALDSFLSGKPSPLCIQALKKSTVRIMPKKEFMALMESDAFYATLWKNILEQLVLQQLEREIDLLTYSPAERYRRVKERSPQVFQEVPHKYIASYLRMTPETLSRIKKS
ncbi:MAG: Crp/Fnr family transcriptional regulator [Flavobacteriales bacterium]